MYFRMHTFALPVSRTALPRMQQPEFNLLLANTVPNTKFGLMAGADWVHLQAGGVGWRVLGE